MNLSLPRLLDKFKAQGIVPIEVRQLPDDDVDVYTFRATKPSFPFGTNGRRFFWASLSVKRGASVVSKKEVEAVLRHLWHGDMALDDLYEKTPARAAM